MKDTRRLSAYAEGIASLLFGAFRAPNPAKEYLRLLLRRSRNMTNTQAYTIDSANIRKDFIRAIKAVSNG